MTGTIGTIGAYARRYYYTNETILSDQESSKNKTVQHPLNEEKKPENEKIKKKLIYD
jgi:hypothetical protein